jgi:hypothetical protein
MDNLREDHAVRLAIRPTAASPLHRADTARVFVDQAFDRLLRVADRLGDDVVNVRPIGADTTSVAALVAHCCRVAEYWLGQVAVGEPSDPDRELFQGEP